MKSVYFSNIQRLADNLTNVFCCKLLLFDPLAAPIIIRPVKQTLNCTKFDDSLILLKCIQDKLMWQECRRNALCKKNPPAGRFSCCFMSWKIHCYCHKELKPSNNTDKCFFSTLVLNILYYRSLFFSCHISVQKLSNPLQLYHDTEPDQISESRYPDTQILHHSIYNALQLTV